MSGTPAVMKNYNRLLDAAATGPRHVTETALQDSSSTLPPMAAVLMVSVRSVAKRSR